MCGPVRIWGEYFRGKPYPGKVEKLLSCLELLQFNLNFRGIQGGGQEGEGAKNLWMPMTHPHTCSPHKSTDSGAVRRSTTPGCKQQEP